MENLFSHFDKLNNSYDEVSKRVYSLKDFSISALESSRAFFCEHSLKQGQPKPIDVDVYALLAGIPFEKNFLEYISQIITSLNNILLHELKYFVKPQNLGVEYVVLKWPNDPISDELIKKTINYLKEIQLHKFRLHVYGIQMHEDGCIILKCIDESMNILNTRNYLLNNINGLPKKQSNWCHIPIGRILYPIGEKKMVELKELLRHLNQEINYYLIFDKLHLVNERKWYMEDKEYIYSKVLI